MIIDIKFKPQDLWIGLYWKKTNIGGLQTIDLWICILPMIPIHFRWGKIVKPKFERIKNVGRKKGRRWD
jgi:hypothetical protein